jgi:hypothetical protein
MIGLSFRFHWVFRPINAGMPPPVHLMEHGAGFCDFKMDKERCELERQRPHGQPISNIDI